VVANLALTASGVGMESYPDSPGGLIFYCFIVLLLVYYYNLNILLMARHEHPTPYQPASTSIRLVLPFPSYNIVICMCSFFVHGIVVTQQFNLNKGYPSSYCSTTGGVSAVHVSTAKFIQNVVCCESSGLVKCTLSNESPIFQWVAYYIFI